MFPEILTFDAIRAAYAKGRTPADLIEEVIRRCDACSDPAVFISRAGADVLRKQAAELSASSAEGLPLYGIPFAVKDNIDVAGLETTAGCPAFAYEPAQDATVIARLRAAGAIVIGKTNLDQFATGLNGTRSPYGAPRSVFSSDYVSGGSSSGSAVAVGAGLCAFSLGTDTAGSGRVPAAFNNLVGIKPTPGLVPNTGVVPACRSVDVVTVFASSVTDGIEVRRIMQGHDAADPFSRHAVPVGVPPNPRIGVLRDADREFHGDADMAAIYDAAIERARALGATLVPFDYTPFRQAAELLYDGPWVAERMAAVQEFMATNPDDFDPTVRSIIAGAGAYTAVDAFNGQYRLEELRQQIAPLWSQVDMLLLPTSPTTATVAAMHANPISENSKFGLYTNFANLLGYAAIAVPAGFSTPRPGGVDVPGGVFLVGPSFSDDALAPFAAALHQSAACGAGKDRKAKIAAPPAPFVPDGWITLAVVGAHLRGMPLNFQLTERGGVFLSVAETAPIYRLYALTGTVPPKPGLARADHGAAIALELWALPPTAFATFVDAIPAPLGIGRVQLDGGREVAGFLCEQIALAGAQDITQHQGWRAYLRDGA